MVKNYVNILFFIFCYSSFWHVHIINYELAWTGDTAWLMNIEHIPMFMLRDEKKTILHVYRVGNLMSFWLMDFYLQM